MFDKRNSRNKITGHQRKEKSILLIRNAIDELNAKNIKPTIMQVAKLLKGRLGETTIKKYWRKAKPKTQIDSPASIKKYPEGHHTAKIIEGSNAKLTTDKLQESIPCQHNFVELFIKEWNLKIYTPKYFEIVHNVDTELAIKLYQRQFRRYANSFYEYW